MIIAMGRFVVNDFITECVQDTIVGRLAPNPGQGAIAVALRAHLVRGCVLKRRVQDLDRFVLLPAPTYSSQIK